MNSFQCSERLLGAHAEPAAESEPASASRLAGSEALRAPTVQSLLAVHERLHREIVLRQLATHRPQPG